MLQHMLCGSHTRRATERHRHATCVQKKHQEWLGQTDTTGCLMGERNGSEMNSASGGGT